MQRFALRSLAACLLAWTLGGCGTNRPVDVDAAPSPAPAAKEQGAESPWLLTPTLSNDPKLGATLGFVAGRLFRADAASSQSMVASFGTYSNTDSWVGGLFGDLYWRGDARKAVVGGVGGRIRNDYEDFLGTGANVETDDDLQLFFLRYLQRVASHWYIGAQAISSNYAIGADGALGFVLAQVGLVGFDSNGVGLVGEFDSRDNLRNPGTGSHLVLHNIAYREGLGGDESFDVYAANYAGYYPFGEGHVLATQVKGRWTDDAPLGGYSSVSLRGYTRGNYLEEHYTHLDLDLRLHLWGRWGASVFLGAGCLYASLSDCDGSDALYPAGGAGVIYTLKPEAGIVLRAEYAVGRYDNSAFYVSFGHPF